ncbi:hypothetical protein AB0F92_30230, partial [Kitasatospora aureofaciens]
ETTVLLVDAERHADAAELLPLIDVPTVLTLGPSGGAIGEDVIAASAHRPAEEPAVRIGPGDDLGIRHTGGTTALHLVDAIPLTAVGKPDRKRLREAVAAR